MLNPQEHLESQSVAVLGASNNPDRYSYKAFQSLKKHGYHPLPVSPYLASLEGEPSVGSLKDLSKPVDTVTMYVNPRTSDDVTNDILFLKPRRVIFNPGSENPKLEKTLMAAGIHVVKACTLVLLDTGKFAEA